MLFDDILLSGRKLIFFPRIIQRCLRVGKAMQIPPSLFMNMIMSVIEEIIMKQSSTDNITLFAAYPQLLQLFPDRQTAFGHADTVAVYRHLSVLHIFPCFLKIDGVQNISAVLTDAFPDPPAPFQPSGLFLQLPDCQFPVFHA